MYDIDASTLIVSAILTWGIGLAPPLLIRYAFLKRPIGVWPAIVVCAIFWLFNILLFTALGSRSKTHAALTLVAFASYWILRKGSSAQTPAAIAASSRETRSLVSNSVSAAIAPTKMATLDLTSSRRQTSESVHLGQSPPAVGNKVQVNPSRIAGTNSMNTPTEKRSAAHLPSVQVEQTSTPPLPAPQFPNIDEEAIYDRIGQELEDEKPDRATWTKAFAEANGDEKRAKAAYIRLRFEKLLTQESNLLQARTEEIENLARREQEALNARAEERANKITELRTKFLSGKTLNEAEITELVSVVASDTDLGELAEPHYGNTLLHLAAEAGLTRSVERLLEFGAPAAARNGNGKRPFEICKYPSLVTILEKAAVQNQNEYAATREALLTLSATPIAARFRNLVRSGQISELSAALMQTPHLANIVDSDGRTPLMLAVYEGNLGVSRLLLAYGADPNTVNDFGQTARSIAEKAGNSEIVLEIDAHKRGPAGG